MGHDISAYKLSSEKVAYHRRNAFSAYNKRMYEALDCVTFYGGVSGYGNSAVFDKTSLQKAIDYITNNPVDKEVDEEDIQFLKDCIKHTNEYGEIVISFC